MMSKPVFLTNRLTSFLPFLVIELIMYSIFYVFHHITTFPYAYYIYMVHMLIINYR